MSKLPNYTDQEWLLVRLLPETVGLAMSNVAKSGVIGTVKERSANSKAYFNAKEKYKDNRLIQAILPSDEDIANAMSNSRHIRSEINHELNSLDIKTTQDLIDFVLKETSNAVATVTMNETQKDADEYKTWVLEIAQHVAKAGKEGDFLGFGGKQFSPKEKHFFVQLNELLS